MADIAVFHASIMAGGGAEAVGAYAVQSLASSRHDVTLYSTDTVNIDILNNRHGTAIPKNIPIEQPAKLRRFSVDAFTAALASLTGITDLPLFRRAVIERALALTIGGNHDLVVSTDGPFAAPDPVVEYVHFPYYDEEAMRRYDTRFSERLYPAYHRVCRALRPSKSKQKSGENSITLTNSQWTADVIESSQKHSPAVVYPPVRTDDFDPPPWDDMEDGFVSIGRIHPLKRQHMAIEIVDELRARGVETHLHLIGACGSEEYLETLHSKAKTRPYIHIEGEVSRSRLVELVEIHRYGLHARQFEHFGIANAEMIAGETIPFVHDSGGQVEVVPDPDRLAYESVEDAARKAENVIESLDLQSHVREQFEDRRTKFSQERFQEAFLSHVDRALSRDN